MDETKLIELIEALGTALRADMSTAIDALSKKCDALDEKIVKKSLEGGDMARQVAADDEKAGHRTVENKEMRADSTNDIAITNSRLNGLARDMVELKKQVSRPMSDLNHFADAQAKADAVMRTHGESASPPMAGEDIVAYNIRLARKMQPHSKTWKGVELSLIAADRQAFNIALDGIRADALHAGLNPVDLPEFQHRKIVQESPAGHKITTFVGNGTIFKQLSRPVRHVAFIGVRGTAHH
jgi:hypothetical protein